MIANATPFAAEAIPFLDERGLDVVVLIAKATFVERRARLVLADDQAPIRMADVPSRPSAADDESSIRHPSDVSGEKAGADIVVIGDAVPPRPVPSLDVAVRFPKRTVSLRVHGERLYYMGAFGVRVGAPRPFERAAITYERAYGGRSADGSLIDWRNPVGRGTHKAASELDGAPAPCVEDPADPIQDARPSTPVGFGAIPMWWLPRRDLAGTMDEAWRATTIPLPPADFDRRFYQVAPPRMQMDRPLLEGDMIAVHGLCPGGLFQVTVPALPVTAHVRRASGPPVSLPLAVDTALLEPEAGRVELTLRKVVPLGRGSTLLREVRFDVAA